MSTILKTNTETVAHTSGRASSIVIWILQVLLAAILGCRSRFSSWQP